MSVLALKKRFAGHVRDPSRLHNDFRSMVEGGWQHVDPAIRLRMDTLLTSPDATVFTGTGVVRRSFAGWIFAHLSALFGSPLVRHKGEQVATSVRVAPTANGLRCWHRRFQFSDGTEQLVQTTKVVTPELGLLDAVGAEGEGRLVTKMRMWAHGRSLYFESTRYLLRTRLGALPLPKLLTPGTLFAEHRDLGNGSFRYILAFRHPIWGETFYQDGVFKMAQPDQPAGES